MLNLIQLRNHKNNQIIHVGVLYLKMQLHHFNVKLCDYDQYKSNCWFEVKFSIK